MFSLFKKILLVVLGIGIVLIGAFLVWAFFVPLPENDEQYWVFLDKNGEVLFSEKSYYQDAKFEHYDKLIEALLVVEDGDFWKHAGVDVGSIIRASWNNIRTSDITSGASTLSMQLARVLYLDDATRNWKYKISQMAYALKLEHKYTKEEILQMYLDRVYLGQGATGFAAAANRYFSKPVHTLSLSERATLVGILSRPDNWNPVSDLEASIQRRNFVLSRLYEEGLINQETLEYEFQLPILLNPTEDRYIHAPHFVFWVREQLQDHISSDAHILKVHTTLDKKSYQDVRKIIEHLLAKSSEENQERLNTSLIALRDNKLEVMFGSNDFFDPEIQGEINMTTTKRELGSTLKPFLFGLALEKGYSPLHPVEDYRTSFETEDGSYSPRNFHFQKQYGTVRFRESLGGSYNISAVSLLEELGVGEFYHFLKRLGLSIEESPEELGLSLVLGTGDSSLLELVGAYNTLRNTGEYQPLQFFTRVTNDLGEEILNWSNITPTSERIFSLSTSEWLIHALSDNLAKWKIFSQGSPLELEFPAVVKTGTSNDRRDTYAVGFTPQITVGSWVGKADGTPIQENSHSITLWNTVLRLLNDGQKQPFEYTSEREETTVCRIPSEKYPECSEQIVEFLLPQDSQDPSEVPNLRIVFPGNGDIIHPDSSLVIEIVYGRDVDYYLDGQKLESPIIDSLSVGKHVISVASGDQRDEIEVFVQK